MDTYDTKLDDIAKLAKFGKGPGSDIEKANATLIKIEEE